MGQLGEDVSFTRRRCAVRNRNRVPIVTGLKPVGGVAERWP